MLLDIHHERLLIGHSEYQTLTLPIWIPDWLTKQQIQQITFQTVDNPYPDKFTYHLHGSPKTSRWLLIIKRTDFDSGWGQSLEAIHNLRIITGNTKVCHNLMGSGGGISCYFITCPQPNTFDETSKFTLEGVKNLELMSERLDTNWVKVTLPANQVTSSKLLIWRADCEMVFREENSVITTTLFPDLSKIFIFHRLDHWSGYGIFGQYKDQAISTSIEVRRTTEKLEDPRFIGITRTGQYVFLNCTWENWNCKRAEVIYFNQQFQLVDQWKVPDIVGLKYNKWEKNWSPVWRHTDGHLPSDQIQIVYSHDPLIILTLDLTKRLATLDTKTQRPNITINTKVRGGSPLIPYQNFYICLVHNQNYYHQFRVYTSELALYKCSCWFRFASKTAAVEFVTSMVPVTDGWLVAVNIEEHILQILYLSENIIKHLISHDNLLL